MASTVVLLVAAFALYLAVVWVAVAYFVLRDARRRSTSTGFIALAALLGFIPPFIGSLVYLIIRPPLTLEQERTMALEERALIDPEIGAVEQRACPNCGRDIEAEFVVCPYCRTQFSRRCTHCDRILRLGWDVCPYCANDVGVRPLRRGSHAS